MKSVLMKSINLPSLLMGAASVLGGTAAATVRGNGEVVPTILCLIFALSFQAGANLIHRHYDDLYMVSQNMSDGFYEQHSREEFYILLKGAAFILFVVSLMAAFALVLISGWWVTIICALLVLMVYLINCRPFCLGRTPVYIFLTFLLFGPIGTIGSSLCQSQINATEPFSWYDIQPACAMSIIMGLMAVNCRMICNYESYNKDLACNRRTFTVLLGRRANVIFFFIFGLVTALMGEYSALYDHLSLWMLIIIVPIISFIVNTYISIRLWRDPGVAEIDFLKNLTILNMFFNAFLSLLILCNTGLHNTDIKTYF